MPTFVRPDKCTSCSDQNNVACVQICPHDLMRLYPEACDTGFPNKAYNQEPEQCWECYACVKACPHNAIEVRHYADVVPMGGSVIPQHDKLRIQWSIQFRNGVVKEFEFPVRTTEPGSINPSAGKPVADKSKLEDPGFFCNENGYREGDRSELIQL